MKIMLDSVQHTSKPTDLVGINNRLAKSPVDISITELGFALEKGQSFCCGYFGKPDSDGIIYRRNDCWTSQQVFGLDFDDGITMDDFMETCINYGIIPAIMYTTFSHTDEHHKFRALWQVPQPITDHRLRWLVIQSLAHVFGKKNDTKCYDPARLFFGGKDLMVMEPDRYIDPYSIVVAATSAISDRDTGEHVARDIKQFCKIVWLNMVNGVPNVEFGIAKNGGKNQDHRVIYIWSQKNPPENATDTQYYVSCDFTVSEDMFEPVKTDKWGRESLQKGDTTDTKMAKQILDYNPKNIAHFCKTAQDFERCEYICYDLRWMLSTWYVNVKGGAKYFLDKMYESKCYDNYRVRMMEISVDHNQKRGYFAARCSEKCPYYEQCNQKYLSFERKLGIRPEVGGEVLPKKALNVAELEFKAAYNRAMEANDHKIYIIKAPTGIGKTEMLLGSKNTVIGEPTHALREEVLDRFVAAGHQRPATVPEIPFISDQINKSIEDCYEIGDYAGASKILKWCIDNGRDYNKDIKKYADELDRYALGEGNAVVTHDRLIFQKRIKHNTIVFDEDPFFSLFSTSVMYPNAIPIPDPIEKQIILERLDKIKSYELFQPQKIFGSGMGKFLQADFCIKTEDGRLNCIQRRELPKNKKIIILSATIDETIYRQAYGGRIDFVDIENVEMVGKIVQDMSYTYSRACFEENKWLLPTLVNNLRMPYITFKGQEGTVEDFIADLHFGATQGRDYMKSMDLMVAGTPHGNEISYKLFAAAIGFKFDIGAKLAYQTITRNGLTFKFMTYADPALRTIQLYLIENELYQAIGRARLLREDATVFLFSNYPLPEATQMKLM